MMEWRAKNAYGDKIREKKDDENRTKGVRSEVKTMLKTKKAVEVKQRFIMKVK